MNNLWLDVKKFDTSDYCSIWAQVRAKSFNTYNFHKNLWHTFHTVLSILLENVTLKIRHVLTNQLYSISLYFPYKSLERRQKKKNERKKIRSHRYKHLRIKTPKSRTKAKLFRNNISNVYFSFFLSTR